MKKNFKRWIAFLLAVVLIAGTCVHSSDAFLRADGGDDSQPAGEQSETRQEMTVSSDDGGGGSDEDDAAGGEYSDDEDDGSEDEDEYSGDEDNDGDSESGDDSSDSEDEYFGDEGDDSEDENVSEVEDGNFTDESDDPDGGEADVNEEDEDGVEENESFGYTVYFYYDGVEDESARVSGEGRLEESILGSLTIENKKEHDGKNYVLESIDNKNGVITEDAGSNVVRVYYVLEEEKPEEKFGYEIRFYYDGKKGDVKKGEGMPGKEILASVTIEDKKEFNGKDYILDSIENEDGRISKEADENVVNVYYILAEEDVKTYSLKFESNLSEGGKAEVISVSPNSGKVGSVYKEDTKVTFEVSVNDGYELSSVENQNGKLKAQSEKDGVSIYRVTMTEDMVITVTYEEAQAQELTASAGKVAVTIDAPKGVLPIGTVAEVQSVDSDDVADAIMTALAEKDLYPTEITAVDITLLKDGSKVSPKGDVTVKLDNVFDTDISGKEAAVYYVNGGSAEYVGGADPASSDVTFTTNHFSIYAAVKAVPMDEIEDGVMTLDERERVGVNRGIKVVQTKGKLFMVSGTSSDKSHSWTVDNNNVVTIDKESDSNIIWLKPGEQAGTAVLTHFYGEEREYWTINVIEEESQAVLRIYVYIEVEAGAADTTGWTLNGSGFYTVGYIDIEPSFFEKELNKDEGKLFNYLKNGIESKTLNVVVLNDAININLSDVTWKNVVSNVSGADDFEYEGNNSTFHLNGMIEMESGSFKVEYYKDSALQDTREVKKPIKKGADSIPVDAKDFETNPFGDEYELEEYEIGEGKVSKDLPTSISKDGTIKVYYVSKSKPCKVTYILNGGNITEPERDNIKSAYGSNVEIGADSITFSVKTGDRIPVIGEPDKDGYIFDGWTPTVDGIVIGDLEYTAQYKRDASLISVEGEEAEYDTMSHKVIVKGIKPGETLRYSKSGKGDWKSDDGFEWPKEVKDSGTIYVQVIGTDGKPIQTEPYSAEVKITKRPVTITVPNATKEFDKDKLDEFEPAEITIGGKAVGESQSSALKTELKDIQLNVTSSGINTKYDEVQKGVLTLESGETADSLAKEYGNFAFEIRNGDLKISRSTKSLIVQIENVDKVYSKESYSLNPIVTLGGEALTQEQLKKVEYVYTVTSNGKTESGTVSAISGLPGWSDAGNYTISVVAKLEGYTDSVSASATLTINKKPVTITAPDAEAVLIGSGTETNLRDLHFVKNVIGVDELCEGDSLFVSGETKYEIELEKDKDYTKVQPVKEAVGVNNFTVYDINPNYSIEKVIKGTLHIKGTVTYNPNGNNVTGAVPEDKNEYRNNAEIRVQGSNGLTKPEAVFLGWSKTQTELITSKEAEIAADIIENSITMGDANITLYAVWAVDANGDGKADYDQFRLIYDLNGGTGNLPATEYYNEDEIAELHVYKENDDKPVKDNAVFLGWSATQTTSFQTQPEAGIIIDSVVFEDEDITVYAVWAEDAKGPEGKSDGVPDYLEKTVSYATSRGSITLPANNASIAYEVGTTVNLTAPAVSAPDALDNQVIAFANQWKDNESGDVYDNELKEFVMPDRNVVLNAQWKVLQIEKSIENESAEGYKADDPITFIIKVKNNGDVAFDAKIEEAEKFAFSDGSPTQQIHIEPSGDVELSVNYTVTEDDLRSTGLSNTVTGQITDVSREAKYTKDVKLIDAKAGLSVEKVVTNQGPYDVGDKITFDVTVTNTGSLTVTGIEVTDSFEVKIESGSAVARFFANLRAAISGEGWGNAKIEKFDLKPGKSKTVQVTYEVQEKDLGAVGYRNHAIAAGTVEITPGESKEVKGEDWSDEITIKDAEESFELTKEIVSPGNQSSLVDGKYPVGSTVEYKISIVNTGNTTLKGKVIEDVITYENGASAAGRISDVELTSKNSGDVTVDWDGVNKFTVSQVPRGETVEFTYKYVVDSEDAGKRITNTAILDEKEAAPENPIEVVNKELTVEKKADAPKDGEKYKLGETINYTVTVKNTGNVSLSDIKVWDELELGKLQAVPADGQSDEIESLPVGESQDFHYTYKVTEDDLENVLGNKAIASVDGKQFESNLVQSEIEEKAETATLEKNITNLSDATGENGRFKSGDTIHYEIKVENTGTLTLKNVTVTDTMKGMTGEITNVSGASFSQKDGEIIFTIPSIPSKGIDKDENYTGNVATITYDYVVAEKDAGAEISNTAVISSYLDDKDDNTSDTETVTIEKKSLDVTKEIVAVRPDGEPAYEAADSSRSFNTGDTVRFAVTVKNDGNTDLSNVTVTDTMSGENNPAADFIPGESDTDSQSIANLKAGSEVTLIYDYTVRPEDISSDVALTNTAKAISGNVESKEAKVDVQRTGKASGYTVEKKIEPENPDRMYRVGEKIPFSIEVLNTGNTTYPAGEVVVADVMTGDGTEIAVDGSSINVTSDNATWNNGQFVLNVPLGWRERVRIDYTYTVASADEGKELINTAYGSEMKQKDSTVPVTIEKKKLSVTKEVTSTPANGEAYAVDEYIRFKVTLTNDGNVPLEDISVTDRLWSIEGSVTGNLSADEGQNPFADGERLALAVGESRNFEYTYLVKEADLGKSIYNVITAFGEGYSEEKTTTSVKVENPDPKVSLTKSILTPPDGDNGKYKTGTKVTYQILVKNTGNTTLNNVTVKDTMTGAAGRVFATSVIGARMTSSFNDGKWEYTFEIDGEIARGEEKVITYEYVIQKEDAGKKIGNTVAVNGDNITTDKDSDDSEEIAVENRKLTVTKTVREPDRVYKLGEEIFFDVKVDNEGDVTLYGIELVDEMLGKAVGEAELVSGDASGIVLTPGVPVDLVYKYVVQPGDIANNALKNKLTATAVDGTKGEDETDYIKIEGQNPSFSIFKSVIGTGSGEDGKYAIGDRINYEITITNDGNVALPSMTVADRMENANGAIIADSVKAVIDSGENGETPATAVWNKEAGKFELGADIPIGGKAVITYEYEVVAADAGKTIINVAGKPTDTGSKTTQTEIEDRRIIIDKLVTSTPRNPSRGYVAGERITFDVRVANPGNVSLSGISIKDEMQGAIGAAVLVDKEGNALNDNSDKNISLAVGENIVLHYSYEVQRDDIVAGGKEIANKATAIPEDGELRGTTEDTSGPVQVDRLHTLTVYYQYADGSTAVETLVQDFAYGDSFAFTIPAITGYTSTLEGNPVQQAVMFDSTLYDGEDPVFTIIYNAIPTTEPGTDTETEPTATPTPGEGEPAPAEDTPDTPDTPVPPVPPVPPVDEGTIPEAVIVPVAPAAVAAAPGIFGGGAGLVAIGDEPVPLDGVITQDDDGNVVIVPVDEVEVPLADREIDDHKCCILSFLLMLATMLIYTWFTHSMKKRQKKLAELKDQLAEETLKRQLGITDTKNSAR